MKRYEEVFHLVRDALITEHHAGAGFYEEVGKIKPQMRLKRIVLEMRNGEIVEVIVRHWRHK